MADKVEIVNLALQEMGAEPITSLTDEAKTARVMNERFNSLRDSFLRSHPWNFAKARTRLARLEEPPAFGFKYAYALPADWLKILHVLTDDNRHPEEQVTQPLYKVEGGQLLSDHEAVYMIYVRRITNTEEWDALAVDCFVLFLASRTARAITQNLDLAETLEAQYRAKLSEARHFDATDEPARRVESDEWLAARVGAGHYGVHGLFRDIEDT